MKTFLVDAFTTEPFKGNPAGVCFAEQELSDDTMLQIAKELGYSETAFIRSTDKTNTYAIRYFSPKKEIPLCGHATLASAKIIFRNAVEKEIHFITTEGLDLLVAVHGNEFTMQFPVYETTAVTVPITMLDALELKTVTHSVYSPKNKIVLLEIENTQILSGLKPNFNSLVSSYDGINGVLVTARSETQDYDYHYRYFWPWAGTNEDPVTGGVQTFLAKYWAERLHKNKMKAYQSSARTGSMNVELQEHKVLVTGQAVIILEGNLQLTPS